MKVKGLHLRHPFSRDCLSAAFHSKWPYENFFCFLPTFKTKQNKQTNKTTILIFQRTCTILNRLRKFPWHLFFFFLFYFIIYLFIYLWLCWVFVSVLGLSPVAASGGHSSSRCAGLSLSRPLLLRSTGSRRAGSVVVAHGPSRSAACRIFPDQGSNPCPLHWQADSQPLRHQGSPQGLFSISASLLVDEKREKRR